MLVAVTTLGMASVALLGGEVAECAGEDYDDFLSHTGMSAGADACKEFQAMVGLKPAPDAEPDSGPAGASSPEVVPVSDPRKALRDGQQIGRTAANFSNKAWFCEADANRKYRSDPASYSIFLNACLTTY